MSWGSVSRVAGVSAVIAASVALYAAGSAEARGIAIDQVVPPTVTGCNLGVSCAASNLSGQYDFNFQGPLADPSQNTFNLGVFNNLHVYNDGIVTIGGQAALTASLAGGLDSLGASYFAPGFADLGAPVIRISAFAGIADPTLDPDLQTLVVKNVIITWTFNGAPGGDLAMIGLELDDQSDFNPGHIGVDMDFGAPHNQWIDLIGGTPYCDALCQADPDFGIEGVFLPPGTPVGSSFLGGQVGTGGPDYSYDSIRFTISTSSPTALPEPTTWAMLIVGFGLTGLGLRRRRVAARVTI